MSSIHHEPDSTQPTPNSVADAAALLAKFCSLTDNWIISQPHTSLEDGVPEFSPEEYADDRAALIAAQLLAIATQLERLADAQERNVVATEAIALTLGTSPGKTHSAAWFLERAANTGAFGGDGGDFEDGGGDA